MAAYYVQLPGAILHNSFRYLHILTPLSVFGLLSAAREWRKGLFFLIGTALLVTATLPHSWRAYVFVWIDDPYTAC